MQTKVPHSERATGLRSSVSLVLAALTAAAVLSGLSGCSGGGPETTSTTATQTASTKATLSVTLTDSSGTSTNNLAAGVPLNARISLRDGNGNAISGAVVSLSTSDNQLATVTPATILTDGSGAATATLNAAGTSVAGAGYVKASYEPVTSSGASAEGSASFQVNAATVAMNLTSSASSLSPYGTASITATVSINGAPPSTPATVQFNSICLANGKATLATSAQTVNGVAVVTYTDKGCGQTDTITATTGSTQRAVNIAIAPPQAASIRFVGASTSTLVLKGTGGQGYTDTAVVSFQVVDSNGNGISGQTVSFGLDTNAGGITLDSVVLPPGGTIQKLTDSTGRAQVAVQSGSVPTSVLVTASTGSFSTQSNRLVISTGRPSQKFFSLSTEIFNIEGLNFDGEVTRLTARLSDRLGNVVPDGTTVNFVTEGGQITQAGSSAGVSTSTCTTTNGECSVNLVSANFRPVNGRVTVLAYALGEESFDDANGNNLYDAGETFDDLGNTCIDANKNATCNSGEQLIQYSTTNAAACPVVSAFNGAPLLSVANTCDGVWGQAFVRQDIEVTFSGSGATASQTSFPAPGSCSASYAFALRDANNNPLPQGTTVTIANNFVKDASATPKTATVSVLPSVVPNTSAIGGTNHALLVSADSCTAPLQGSFSLITTTPNGVTTVIPMAIN